MRSRRTLLATFVALTLSTAGGVDAAGATEVTTTPALPATLDAASQVTKAKVNLRQTNGKIVFMSTHDGNPEIYAVNPDGSGLDRLTDNDVGDVAPAWSPDGSRIAFTCGIGPLTGGGFSTFEPSDICVMDAEGRGSVRLTDDPVSDGEPAWSPDGRRIAFRRAADLYTMKPDGTDLTRLTTDAYASEPAWSPDGTRIAYVSLQSPCPGGCPLPSPQPFVPQILVMNADGTGAVNLTNDAAIEARHPSWSPDGMRIAYDAHPSAGGEVAIWLMNPDGSAKIRLPPAPGNDSEPAWSPDGTKIVFTRYGNNLGDIFIRNADGTGAVAVTNLPGFDASPDWQPVPTRADDTTLSAFGTARIDGVMGTGEWDRAARLDFKFNLPARDGGGTAPATLYVMNDALSLFVAVTGAGFYEAFGAAFQFDNDNDGGLEFEEGDDVFLGNASYLIPNPRRSFFDDFRTHCPDGTGQLIDCGLEDADPSHPAPGTTDGAAAGFSSATLKSSFLEMSHPLDSADDAHDFSLHFGDMVGFYLDLRVISIAVGPDCGWPECVADTRVPVPPFAHIRVATPVPTPATARSWAAPIAGAGLSGTASLTLPAKGWAMASFSLRHLVAGVSVTARVVAGATGCARSATVVRLPGYTTTTRGTWRQRWVFDGVSLDRLRAAARNGTRLWFEVGAGEHRTCAPLRPVGP